MSSINVILPIRHAEFGPIRNNSGKLNKLASFFLNEMFVRIKLLHGAFSNRAILSGIFSLQRRSVMPAHLIKDRMSLTAVMMFLMRRAKRMNVLGLVKADFIAQPNTPSRFMIYDASPRASIMSPAGSIFSFANKSLWCRSTNVQANVSLDSIRKEVCHSQW